jgi:hypothetical protein
MDFNQFVQWAFYGLLSGAVIVAVNILKHLSESVDKLNERVAIIIEKVSLHEKRLDKHEEKIEELEKK